MRREEKRTIMENEKIEVKSPSKVGTVFFGIWVAVAALLIQGAIGLVGAIPMAVISLQEANGDMELYQSIYLDKVTNSSMLSYVQLVASAVYLIVVAIWYYNGYVKPKKQAGTYESVVPKITKLDAILTMLFGAIGIYGIDVLIQRAASAMMPNAKDMLNTALSLTLNGNEVVGLIIAVILAPIAEEMAVRGIVIQKSKKCFGVVGCMVMSALVFAIMHGNPIQGLYVIPMGLFYGYICYMYDSAVPGIICHMINNLIGTTIGGTTGILVAAGCSIAALIFLEAGKRIKKNKEADEA